jgi:hypothetical protein
MQLETGEIETLLAPDPAATIKSRLQATPHLWGFIAIVYAYLTLFAVVVVLAVVHP